MKKPHHDVIRIVGRLLSVWCIVTLCAMPSTLQAAPPAGEQLTVMSRNLYLGADVYAAARFLPDLQAASQYLWDNMQQTLFVARADAFADEVMRTRPDVLVSKKQLPGIVAMPMQAVLGSSTTTPNS